PVAPGGERGRSSAGAPHSRPAAPASPALPPQLCRCPSLPTPQPCPPTHTLESLVWEQAGLAARCEVAENLEGVSGAALVGVDPVLAWGRGEVGGQPQGPSPGVPPSHPLAWAWHRCAHRPPIPQHPHQTAGSWAPSPDSGVPAPPGSRGGSPSGKWG
uniref:Uncharacterized protein n=1 Tax=Chrysemys picta bellii TaxID=8478 RepID=A0A8C3HLM7_CHRPI